VTLISGLCSMGGSIIGFTYSSYHVRSARRRLVVVAKQNARFTQLAAKRHSSLARSIVSALNGSATKPRSRAINCSRYCPYPQTRPTEFASSVSSGGGAEACAQVPILRCNRRCMMLTIAFLRRPIAAAASGGLRTFSRACSTSQPPDQI